MQEIMESFLWVWILLLTGLFFLAQIFNWLANRETGRLSNESPNLSREDWITFDETVQNSMRERLRGWSDLRPSEIFGVVAEGQTVNAGSLVVLSSSGFANPTPHSGTRGRPTLLLLDEVDEKEKQYMSEEDCFQAAIDDNPEEHINRLVFSDWLQERNDPRATGYRALGLCRVAISRNRINGAWQYFQNLPQEWNTEVLRLLNGSRSPNDNLIHKQNSIPYLKSRVAFEDLAALAFFLVDKYVRQSILDETYQSPCKEELPTTLYAAFNETPAVEHR